MNTKIPIKRSISWQNCFTSPQQNLFVVGEFSQRNLYLARRRLSEHVATHWWFWNPTAVSARAKLPFSSINTWCCYPKSFLTNSLHPVLSLWTRSDRKFPWYSKVLGQIPKKHLRLCAGLRKSLETPTARHGDFVIGQTLNRGPLKEQLLVGSLPYK